MGPWPPAKTMGSGPGHWARFMMFYYDVCLQPNHNPTLISHDYESSVISLLAICFSLLFYPLYLIINLQSYMAQAS